MLGTIVEWVLPTPSTFYFNAIAMPPPPEPVDLPDADWTRRESHALLDSSEDRRRTIETKGPGLATVSAILVAGVLVALSNGWEQSTWPARFLLGGATFYALVSLLVPIYLAGPLRRQALRSVELTEAVEKGNPEAFLALKARAGAAINDHDNLALTNLQDAARKEARFVWALLIVWALLVPLTGFGERTEAPAATDQAPTACLVATNLAWALSESTRSPVRFSDLLVGGDRAVQVHGTNTLGEKPRSVHAKSASSLQGASGLGPLYLPRGLAQGAASMSCDSHRFRRRVTPGRLANLKAGSWGSCAAWEPCRVSEL